MVIISIWKSLEKWICSETYYEIFSFRYFSDMIVC